MPKFRTKKKNRDTYVYRDAYGHKIAELRPGENGITADIIQDLHAEDDAEHNSLKKDSYHGLLHYEQLVDVSADTPHDWRDEDLADTTANPEALLMKALSEMERSGAFKMAWDELTDKQRDLIRKKLEGQTNVDIARDEHTTEAAVRNRLSKIQKRFKKFLP